MELTDLVLTYTPEKHSVVVRPWSVMNATEEIFSGTVMILSVGEKGVELAHLANSIHTEPVECICRFFDVSRQTPEALKSGLQCAYRYEEDQFVLSVINRSGDTFYFYCDALKIDPCRLVPEELDNLFVPQWFAIGVCASYMTGASMALYNPHDDTVYLFDSDANIMEMPTIQEVQS